MTASLLTVQAIQQRLAALGDAEKAAHAQGFFKTGPGQYGEGDLFRGIRVPVLRTLAKEYRALPLTETLSLLQAPMHEDRLLALLILVRAFAKGNAATRQTIYERYLAHTRWINNIHKAVGWMLRERCSATPSNAFPNRDGNSSEELLCVLLCHPGPRAGISPTCKTERSRTKSGMTSSLCIVIPANGYNP